MISGFAKAAEKIWVMKVNWLDVEDLKVELKDAAIVVEGKRDKEPLTNLGFSDIFTISGRTLNEVADDVSSKYRSVLVLTDYDGEGEKKERRLTKLFIYNGIRTLPRLRHSFRKIFKVVRIEDISSMLRQI